MTCEFKEVIRKGLIFEWGQDMLVDGLEEWATVITPVMNYVHTSPYSLFAFSELPEDKTHHMEIAAIEQQLIDMNAKHEGEFVFVWVAGMLSSLVVIPCGYEDEYLDMFHEVVEEFYDVYKDSPESVQAFTNLFDESERWALRNHGLPVHKLWDSPSRNVYLNLFDGKALSATVDGQ